MRTGYVYFKTGFLFLLLSISSTFIYSQATSNYIFQDWYGTDGLSEHVYKASSAYDNMGCLYVVGAGIASITGDYNWLITKYSPAGLKIWSISLDPRGNDQNDFLSDIVIDPNCNLYVCGISTSDSVSYGYDVGVGCLDSSGAVQWTNFYDGGGSAPLFNDGATSITADPYGYIYLTGFSQNSSTLEDIITLQYDMSTGSQQWVQTFDNGNSLRDFAVNVSMFSDVSILVSGAGEKGSNDWGVGAIEYQFDGTYIMDNFGSFAAFDSITEVHDVSISPTKDIYITGTKSHTGAYDDDIKLIKFDSLLNLQWVYNWYNIGKDAGNSVRVDSVGYVYVGGFAASGGAGLKDYIIYQVDTAGSIGWEQNYDMGMDDIGKALVLDDNDNPILTGYIWNVEAGNLDYYTLKADKNTGNMIWGINFNGLANNDDMASEIALGDDGSIYVVGQSEDSSGTRSVYTTVKYVEHELYNVPDSDTLAGNFEVIPNWGQLLNQDTVTNVNTTVMYYSPTTGLYFENDKIINLQCIYDTSLATTDTMVRIDMNLTSDPTRRAYVMDKSSLYANFYMPHTAGTGGLKRVPTYEQVVYPELWKGIDLQINALQKQDRMQFVVKQIGDPDDIVFNYSGADSIYIDGSGNLVIENIFSTIIYEQPVCSQIDSSGNYVSIGWQPIYNLNADTVTFDSIGVYNPNLPLVIEMSHPTISFSVQSGANLWWSTYYGPFEGSDVRDLRVLPDSRFIVCGQTRANAMPTGQGETPFSSNPHGLYDAYFALFNANLSGDYYTIYGGSGQDYAESTTFTSTNFVVVGTTNSTDLFDHESAGLNYNTPDDVFIFACDYTGAFPTLDSYIKGTLPFNQPSVHSDISHDYVVLTGTCDTAFNLVSFTGGYNQSHHGASDVFIIKLEPINIGSGLTGHDVLWSTCFGGYADEWASDIIVDGDTNIVIGGLTSTATLVNNTYPSCPAVGTTQFPNCIRTGAYNQVSYGGNVDHFVAKFNNHNKLIYSSMLGDAGVVQYSTMFYNGDREIIIAGDNFNSTGAIGFPAQNGATYSQQTQYGDGGFVAKFDGSYDLVWYTYFGGDKVFINDVTMDAYDNIYIAGNYLNSAPAQTTGLCSEVTADEVPICNDNGNNYMETNNEAAGAHQRSFITLFDPEGVIKWSTKFGMDFENRILALDCLDGDLFAGGYTTAGTGNPSWTLADPGFPAWFQGTCATPTYFNGTLTKFDNIGNPIGIEETMNNLPQIGLFPNPTDGVFNLDLGANNQEIVIEIFDIHGRKLKFAAPGVVSGLYSMDISAFASGIYFVNLLMDNTKYSFKVIKH